MTLRAKVLLAVVFMLFSVDYAWSQSCNCEVSERKERAYNILLELSAEEQAIAEALHLPWGRPEPPSSATNERVLHQEHYLTWYDADLRVPLWVAYRLTYEDVNVPRTRLNCFRRDPRLTDEATAALCEDYQEPIFDRGHMVPSADMLREEAAMINTFMFTNMVPQHDRFNQRIWNYLEQYVRKWAELKGEIYVVSGAIFDKDGNDVRDDDADADRVAPIDRVAVPTHFYKIILHERNDSFIETMTFLLEHVDSSPDYRDSKAFLKTKLVNIDRIEALTGIDFLSQLKADNPVKEAAVEGFTASVLWPTQ